jgi:hypothetical protein
MDLFRPFLIHKSRAFNRIRSTSSAEGGIAKDAAFLMSTLSEKPASWRILLPYLIAVGAVSCAVIGTSWLGPALKHSSIILFCSVILPSWHGRLLPGLFAASLSWLALGLLFHPADSFSRDEPGRDARDNHLWRRGLPLQLAQ